MLTTTLNKIRAASPCKDGWENLLRHLGKIGPDDEALPVATILDANGIEDTLWVLDRVIGENGRAIVARTYAAAHADERAWQAAHLRKLIEGAE